MFEPDDRGERERKGASAGERIGLGLFVAFIVFAFGMELRTGSSPARWAIPLMALFWIPLLFVHEAGHALMARALGWRVERVVIGFGAPWHTLVLGGVPIELRSLPVEGFVQTRPADGIARPGPHAAIYFAGPGIELLLAGLLVLWPSGPIPSCAPATTSPSWSGRASRSQRRRARSSI